MRRLSSLQKISTSWVCLSKISNGFERCGARRRQAFASRARAMSADDNRPKPRAVVTVFVENGSGQFLVEQRSGQVRTYPHKWGGVSGGVEGDEELIDRARAEMVEEVGLGDADVQFKTLGRPLYVRDGSRAFLVHPFLFSLITDEPNIKLNWESEAWRWVSRKELQDLDTVPLLVGTLERLIAPESQRRFLNDLQNDRSHGAAELALWVCRALRDEAEHLREGAGGVDGDARIFECVQNFGFHIATSRPAMSPIANTAVKILARAKGLVGQGKTGVEAISAAADEAISAAADEARVSLETAAEDLTKNVGGLIADGATIFTTSYSSTILRGIKAAASGKSVCVTVCESRPLNEGVRLACELRKAGIRTTVVTDAQAGVFIGKADVVLVGADSITQTGVVNKVGTFLIALAAHEKRIPVYAVADTSKVSAGPTAKVAGFVRELPDDQEEKGPEEVYGIWGPVEISGLEVRNVYFESTPLELFRGVVCEHGVLNPTEIRERIKLLEREYVEAFDLVEPRA